tara:strand:+ start:54 stop:584 length:531 start_codon:yes stop_codon:yes gene_type:complete
MALPAVLAGAASAIGRAVATQAGRKAVLEGAKKYGKKALEVGNTKAGQALTAGQMASNVGMQQANRQQMQQQNMINQSQQMAQAAKAGSEIQTSEPMDLAWRMLKGELQLPNEISEDMRHDLAVLDRNHTFEDTSDGTMVGNIHPDMEHVVKLLTGMQEDVDDIAKPTYTPPQFYY